jgi:hypothetical protein
VRERKARRGAKLGQAGFAEWAEREAPTQRGEKKVFQFLFSNKFQTTVSNQILSKKMAFSGNGPKMKVA